MAHGFSVQGGLGAGGPVILHESSDHSVLVPDTELLFTAQFHRVGPDLVLTGRDGQHHLVPGYFSSEHHPALVAPNGAHLSAATVDLLAGSAMPGHYAQAQPAAPPDSIGKIEKVVGDVTVVRNGVAVALHVGDAVFKSDVVATGSSSSCGISFPDGTALNLVANTRMALNDYAFDANSNSNGALFTLVEGTFAFVAGKVAHQGDMKIATPVATMGIRGTTGVVQEQPSSPATITANAGDHTYSFAVVPDIGTGITGVWDCYLTDAQGNIVRDANGNPIILATVSQSGLVTYLTPQGLGQPPLVSTEPATNSQYAFEQEMLQQLFRTLNPANLNNNNNGGSSTTPPPFELPNPIPQLFEDSGKPFTVNVPGSSPSITVTVNDTVGSSGPLTVVIWIAANSGPWSAGPSWLGGAPPIVPQEVEILNPVKVTTDGTDGAAGLVINAGAILNIVSGTSFTIYDFIHGAGTIALNSSGSDPTLFIHGGVTLVGGGTIKMIGPAGEDNILGVPGTGALLLNIDYTIEGTGTIGGGDGNLTFENFGIVNANSDLLTINTGNQVYNDGLMEATADPLAATAGTLAIKDSVVNAGTVQADGAGAAVTLSGATFDNLFSVVAKNGGSITFTNVAVTNEAVSAADPAGGTINAAGGTIAFNGGSLANGNMLEATNGGTLQLENIVVTNSGAGSATIDATSNLDLIGASILGNTIENDGNAVITGGASVLHGHAVTNAGTMTVETGASLTLEGDTTLINEASGLIKADGAGATVAIEIDTDTNVNSGTIQAVNGGEVDFYINVDGGSNHGLIEAGAGGTVHFFDTHGGGGGGGPTGGNYGTMEATDGGHLIFGGGLDNFFLVQASAGGIVNLNQGVKNHAGTVESTDLGSQINISDSGSSENADTIIAENSGSIVFSSVVLQNDTGAKVEATSGGSIDWQTGGIDNFGTFDADGGAITFEGDIGITNEATGTFEALNGGSILFKAATNGSVTNDNLILASGAGSTITFDSSLNGAQNTGTIEADAGGTVTIDGFAHNNALFNTGLIEATPGGIVAFDGAHVVNENGFPLVKGTISAAGAGATVQLLNSTIDGGIVQSTGDGIIETLNGTSTLNALTVGDGTVLQTDASGTLDLENAISLAGTLTLQGDGVFVMNDGSIASAVGATATLINASTITGWGTIGNVATTLENQGVINANLSGQFIGINTADNDIVNSGTMEATNGGYLQLDSNVDNTDGLIAASSSGTVYLETITITHGNLKTDTGGLIDIDGGNSTFDSLTIEAGSQVRLQFGSSLTLEGSIENDGTVTVTGVDRDIVIAGTVSLTGSGAIVLAGSGEAVIGQLNGHNTLDNASTIEGAGQIGGPSVVLNNLVLDNELGGTVDADLIGKTLTVHTGNAVTNAGTLEATGGGTLVVNDDVTNTGGTIAAHGSGSVVELDGVTVTSGAMVADTGGTIETGAGGATLHDVDVTDSSTIVVASGTTLTLEDGTTITGGGTGTLTINSSGSLDVNEGTVTLDGVKVTDNGAIVVGASSATTLALYDGTTVRGGGVGTLTVASGSTLAIDHGGATLACLAVDNCGGDITVAADTTLTLNHVIVHGGAIDGTDAVPTGSIVASTIDVTGDSRFCNVDLSGGDVTVEKGATLTLNGGTVSDVTLQTNGDGLIEIGCGGGTFDGVTINDGSILKADTGSVLDLEDTTTINGTVTFEGGGTFVLDPGPASIVGGSDGGTIDIAVGAKLTGSGDVGNAGAPDATSLTLNNGGTIDANVSGATLDIDTGNTVTNTGTLEATNCGTLKIDDAVNNAGGMIKALHGGTVTFDGGTLDDESATAGVAGGLVEATARGATVTIDNVTVTLDSAVAGGGGTIKASNGGAIVFNGGTVNSATSAPVSGGLIEALTCGTITFNGTTVYNQGSSIEADGIGAMILLAGATILGGTLETSASGIIETVACSGDTTLDGVSIATGSTIQVDDHTTLTLQDTVDANATVTNDGTITLVRGCDPSLIVNGDITLAGHGTVVLSGDTDSIVGTGEGTDTLHNANTIEGAGTIGGADLVFINQSCGVVDADASGHTLVLDTGTTVTNLGTLEATHGGILEIDDNVCNIGGTIAAYGCGSVVELEGVTIKGGMFLTDDSTSGDRGVIEVVSTDNATVFDGGGSHAISIGGFVQVDAGATLKLIGTIDLAAHGNNGTIDLAQISTCSGDIGADLVICGTVRLTGSGGITMHGHADEITAGAPGALLNNAASISGAGSIGTGDDWLHLANETAGVINADNASADSLTIDIGCNTIHNHGLMEATGGGTLVLNSDVDNSCGTIEAVGCNSTVNIDQITVSHGTLQTSCDGLIQVVCGESTFCDVHVNGGNLTVEGDATLKLSGVTVDGTNIDDYTDSGSTVIPGTIEITGDSAINNSTVEGEGGPAGSGTPGVITVDCHTTLTLDNTTLEDLNLTNNGALHVAGASDVTTLDDVSVANNGCIEVDVTNSGAILTLDDDSTITGGKLMIGSAGALDIATGNDGSGHGATLDGVAVTNDSGNIDVGLTDSGAILTLDDDTTIAGGNLTTGTYGALHIATGTDGSGATLDGVNVIDNGDINLDSGAILTLDDGTRITGTATGTLTIAAGDTVDVEHGSGGGPNYGAVFDGLTVNDNGGALDIGDVISGAILTLEDGTTITGGGSGTMTIHANNTVDVEKGANEGINGATLDGVHVTDCGALDVGDHSESGATLTLGDGTEIIGSATGSVTIDAGSAVNVADGATVTLDGVQVADNGTLGDISADSGATLILEGGTTITGSETGGLAISHGDSLEIEQGCGPNQGATFDALTVENAGTIQVDATLTIADAVSLNDGGTVSMATSGQIVGDGSHASLENVDNVIAGAGSIGGGCLTLSNDANGTILANVSAATLTLDTGANTISNAGLLEASGNGATLDIKSHVDNSGGSLLAASGGLVDVESAICGGTATIHGATLEFDSSSNVHVTFDNGSVDSPTYGMLVLGDPEDFHGIISDFTGTCADSAHSDVIDLQGIDYNSHCFNECYNSSTGVLTITDGTHTAYLNFDDFAGKFKFASDGNGGTDVYDPPVGGAKDAPATATAAPGNDHVAASANQNGTDHAAGPANEAGFLGDSDSAAAANAQDGAAAPPTNQLALAGDTVTAPPSATATDVSTQGLLSSLLKTLTGGADGAASPIDLGSGHGQAEIAPALVTTAPSNEHISAPTPVTPPPAASPTVASASFGTMGNDSFAFHASLGSNPAQNTDAHTSELAHGNVQISGPPLASTAPEFHQEFAFDALHQDAANLSAVDQFHQVASNSTLLH